MVIDRFNFGHRVFQFWSSGRFKKGHRVVSVLVIAMNCIKIELHMSERHTLNGHTSEPRKPRSPTRCDHSNFDWEKVGQELVKFSAIPCRKPADRVFLCKVLAVSQTAISPWTVWDALEAVRQIGPRIPIAYFRTVLKDNCQRAGVDLDKALRSVRLPHELPRYQRAKRRTTPIPEDALRLRMDELQRALP